MTDVLTSLNAYERRARLLPGLLVLAPLLVTAILTGVYDRPVVTSLVAALCAIGGPVVLASLVREHGLAAQGHLFAKWGGPPTTLLLRVGSDRDVQRQRRRANVEAAVGYPLPSASEEVDDHEKAIAAYAAAVEQLRALTQDERLYPLIQLENRNYGFARNMYGMKLYGMLASFIGLGTNIAVLSIGLQEKIGAPTFMVALAGVSCALIGLGWVRLVTEGWVRRSAERYAEQLLQAPVAAHAGKQAMSSASGAGQ